MANPFTVQPLGGLRSVANIQQGMQGIAQNFQAQEQQEQQAQIKQKFAEAMERGDPQEIAQLSMQYPEIGKAAMGGIKFANDATRANLRDSMQRVIAGEDPTQVIQERIQMVQSQGGDPSDSMRELQLAQQDPEAYRQQTESIYAMSFPQEYTAFKKATGSGSGLNIGQYNPRDYTTASFAEFAKTGDPSVLERFANQQSVDIGGVPHVFDPSIGGYRPATVSGAAPSATGQSETTPRGQVGGQAGALGGQGGTVTAEDVAGNRSTIVAAEERAKLDAALAKEGYRLTESGGLEPIPGGKPAQEREASEAASVEQERQKFQKADVMVDKIDTALNQVDWNSAGAIGQVAQFVGGTEARDLSANLDTIKANLGFDALQQMREASPTGGALGQVTEKEIRFLQGLIESLDQAQSPTQLRANLEQLRSGVEKTKRMIAGDIKVLESAGKLDNLESGQEYVLADDPARRVKVKGGGGNIGGMSLEELQALNPSDLTDEQLQQAADRYEQLGVQ